jgi:hypothetical protein
VATSIIRPNTPSRAALTVKAKLGLTSARYDITTKRRYLTAGSSVLAAAELLGLGLVEDLGGQARGIINRYAVTANGDIMREYLLRENALRVLGKLAVKHDISGRDMADVAAAVDAGQEDCVGVSVEFYWAFQARAELDRASGEDTRQDLEKVLGWI